LDARIYNILGFDAVKELLASHALSSLGRAEARALVPASTRLMAESRLKETREAETMLIAKPSHPLRSFNDVSSERTRLSAGACLSPTELIRVASLLKSAKYAANSIRRDEEGAITELPAQAELLYYDERIISDIDRSIIGEGEISDDASAELKNIRRRMRRENDFIKEKLASMIKNRDTAKYFQDTIVTLRQGRYVLPVKQEYRQYVGGIVHGESSSGATVFVEPTAVVEANNRLRSLEEEESREIERVLRALTDKLAPYADRIADNLEILAHLDMVFACASLSRALDCCPPVFTEGGLAISAGRHPLIDQKSVIPVSVKLEEGVRALIITGPNTGGKTVTLKLIGLFSLMAMSGLFVPAVSASLPFFTDIFADIGDEQSIEQSLSTFSAHMKNTVHIVKHAGEQSLVLLDELGAGTDPEEGIAIALSILEELANRGVLLFATTHYSEIKAYASSAEGFMNASMEFDARSLKPTYRLIMGVAGASNALAISEKLGLPKYLIEKAEGFMDRERFQFQSLIEEAERSRSTAESRLADAKERERRAKETEAKAKEKEADLAERRRRELERAREEALEIVNAAREEADSIIKELRRDLPKTEAELSRKAEQARRTLAARKNALAKSITENKKPQKTVDPADIKVGDSVRIISMDAKATVLEAPNQKGMVSVQAGIMKLSLHYSDLAPTRAESEKKAYRSHVSLQQRNISLSINVQGQTVEEALDEVDKYLDDAFLSGLTDVTIIHGVGTGALRNGIGRYLKTHPHVKTFRSGKSDEGGAGVTVVTIKR